MRGKTVRGKSSKFIFVLGGALAVLLVGNTPPVVAEPGARSAVTPLPVELVEEQAAQSKPQKAASTPSLTSGPSNSRATSSAKLERAAFTPNGAPQALGESGVVGAPTPGGSLGKDSAKDEGPDESEIAASVSGEGDNAVTTILNVKDAEIATLVKTFSKLTKRNYIVDSNVKGKVTIHLPTPVTIPEALRIFDSVLLLKGFTTVPVEGNTWKVVLAKDARQTTIPLVLDGSTEPPSDALVTQLVRLKYIKASELQQLMSQFVSKEGLLNSVAGTNTLIMIDSSANIRRLQKIVAELDVPATDQDISIIPVLHAQATDIAEKIQDILGSEESEDGVGQQPRVTQGNRPMLNVANRAGQPGIPPTDNGMTEMSGKTLPLKVIPDERTNSLIVVADEATTTKIKALVEQLDSPVDLSGGRFHVYRLKHADAEVLSDIINQLISGAGSSGEGKSASKSSGSSLSSNRKDANSSSKSSVGDKLAAALRERQSARATGTPGTGGGTGGGAEGKVNLEGEVSIAPDPSTNSLIINASQADYQKLKQVIDDLDVKRRQVLVEATILEVSLNKDEGMGIELQGTAGTENGGVVGQTSFGGLTNLLTNPAALTDLTIAAASTGTLTLPGGIVIPSQAILVSAVSRNSNVNVLSTPTILSTDNEEAEIIVGENVPFVTSTSSDPTNLNNTFNQIERQDVGITLRITPQISTGDFVVLKIFVEISNVVPGTRNDPNGPTTTIRTTETVVEVKNGQMIITGGLISDSVTDSQRGVPFLQDIPVLGNFFKRTDTNQKRTNLLVFITPKIMKDQFDSRESTVEKRDDIEGIIREQGTEPSRAEVLHSESIDKVADALPVEEHMPTPVTAVPKEKLTARESNALDRTQERLKALTGGVNPTKQSRASNSGELGAGDSGEEVIDLTVKPKLPQSISKTGSASASQPDQGSSGANTFVVLKEIKRGKGLSAIATDNEGTAGIVVLGSLGSQPAGFFEVGERYKYNNGQELVCIGKYGSKSEAQIIHPSLKKDSAWHALSPEETLSLGNGAWKQG